MRIHIEPYEMQIADAYVIYGQPFVHLMNSIISLGQNEMRNGEENLQG